MNKYYIYLDGKEVDTVCKSDDEELQEYIDNELSNIFAKEEIDRFEIEFSVIYQEIFMIDKLKIIGIITILIIVVGLILSVIGVEIYVWIEYGSKPITEIPAWALWFMWGNSK